MEYDQIMKVFLEIRSQKLQMFKLYLTIITIPITLIAASFRLFGEGQDISIDTLPDIISVVLIVVSIAGLLMCLVIISLRLEALWYVRAINRLRGFFSEKSAESKLDFHNYLDLPISNSKPPFLSIGGNTIWEVMLMGLLNGTFFTLGVSNFVSNNSKIFVEGAIVLLFLYFFIHIIAYIVTAGIKEQDWQDIQEDYTE